MKTQEESKKNNKRIKKFNANWNGVPATKRPSLFERSLYESVFASVFWHIALGLLIGALVFLFTFFGITLKLFPAPKPKMNDIEFIIKNPPRHKINYHKIIAKQAAVDADKATSQNVKKASAEALPKSFEPKSEPKSEPKNILDKKTNVKTTVKAKSGVNTKKGSHSKSNIPDLSMPMPSLKSMSSGLGHSGRTSHHAAGFDSSNASGFSGSSSSSSGGSTSNGGSGFDKNTTRKIIAPYDISPYVSELKRNVRWNWKAPTGSKRVDLFLRIAKDGRIVILNVKRTSEVGEVDNAAINAVRKCQPLNPLPSKYTKSYLDVVFTFDSNSIGSRY